MISSFKLKLKALKTQGLIIIVINNISTVRSQILIFTFYFKKATNPNLYG